MSYPMTPKQMHDNRGLSTSGLGAILVHRFNMADFLAIEFVLLFVVNFLSNIGLIPSAFTYVFDIVNLCILLSNARLIGKRVGNEPFFNVPVALFAVMAPLSGIINTIAPQYIIWQAISFSRLFVWIYLFRIFWDKDYIRAFMGFVYKMQVPNVIFVLIQYYVLGLFQDNIGGIFGVERGCNGILNVYLCIVVAWGLNLYLAKEGRLSGLLLTVLSALLIAAVAELKFFFVEFALIVAISILYARVSRKTIVSVAAIVLLIAVALSVFAAINPFQYETLVDFDALMTEADNSNIETGYGISRLNVFSQISEQFFNGDLFTMMFGFGFGSASQSSMPFFCSPFFSLYGWLNYHFLTSAMVFIQLGYIGTVLFVMPVALLGIMLIARRGDIVRKDFATSGGFSIVMCILFLINCMYNNTAVTYPAVLWALSLCVGLFVVSEIRRG